MINDMIISLDNAEITTFEKGNAGKDVATPVCALGLGKNADGWNVKVLLKNDDARDVYDYMTNRASLREHISKETVNITGPIREVRGKTKEIVIGTPTKLQFNITLEVKVK